MKKSTLIIGVIAAVAASGALTAALVPRNAGRTAEGGSHPAPVSGRVEVAPDRIDFGTVVRARGAVSAKVSVTNAGSGTLTIDRLSTSCGCTKAEMDLAPVPPGGRREMTVTFDPMVHPDEVGPIERVVYLQTSDPERPEVEITLVGTVVDEDEKTL